MGRADRGTRAGCLTRWVRLQHHTFATCARIRSHVDTTRELKIPKTCSTWDTRGERKAKVNTDCASRASCSGSQNMTIGGWSVMLDDENTVEEGRQWYTRTAVAVYVATNRSQIRCQRTYKVSARRRPIRKTTRLSSQAFDCAIPDRK